MYRKNSIKDTMMELKDVFQNSAIELMSVMFNIQITINDTWEIADSSDARYDYIFSQISENKQYKSYVIIGAAYPVLEKILGPNISLDEAKDAFGEFANCYHAVLMDNPTFVAQFGYLVQKVPEDSTILACFPMAWGIQGKINFQHEELFIRFSMEEKKFGDDILAFLDE